MPFAVFRRHRKKMLAVLTLLAMFGFILADSLPRLIQGTAGVSMNPVVTELYGAPVHLDEIQRLAAERSRATRFVSEIVPELPIEVIQRQLFGGTSTREMVDALILEREADALGIPKDPEVAKEWLRTTFRDRVDGRLLERIYREKFAREVTDEQLLLDLANQLRLGQVMALAANPMVTPLDVYQTYRDQNERVSVNAVAFAVAEFTAQVPEPSESELQLFFDATKDRYADESRGLPGFKIPPRARVEYLTIDGKNLAPTISEEDLRARYEAVKETRYKLPPLPRLPDDVFEPDDSPGAVHTTAADWDSGPDPDRFEPLDQVRTFLEQDLIDERTAAAVAATFAPIKAAMEAYADARAEALDIAKESKTAPKLPEPLDLKALAARAGPAVTYDRTPPITRDQAKRYGQLGEARVGTARFSNGPPFDAWLFDDREGRLFEPAELADDHGRYFLAWKIEELEPEVPALNDVRDEVVRAWKLEKARPLAKAAAEELARLATANSGDLKAVAGDKPVITTTPQPRFQPIPPLFAQQGINLPPRPSDLPPLQQVGEDLRDAAFGLKPQEVVVAPNAPQSIYYVLSLNSRTPATFDALYAPFSERARLAGETRNNATQRQFVEWMNYLRSKARLDPNWVPPEEERTRRRGPSSL